MDRKKTGSYAVSGIWIRLPEERWQHIVEEHPELEDLRQEVLLTVERPLKVLAGSRGELLAVREMRPGKFLVVVYKETSSDDGFIITAFLTRRVGQLGKRVVVWPKQ
ncbi:hypothetical protein SAMN00808754_2327 [Thermanaeromonas toyohensis ToBE]|uniref:Phage-Barnase-EndoU-ColicinE5/D-RelE like nuclease 2 domain-containing protein n=1 Tax=Thermanaeromonas toyohensis ToBE TaxID=698762 RepID=A0A1W1VYU5_9FIRM|nr:hypothetical protein [Thermanaeromonas toyohensis]SMB98433.1 hypothetical protein SAMN00808754_2327 [Thermanaeromonas toyohensis ToBE]